MIKKKKIKILLLNIGITFMSILGWTFMAILAIGTLPIWGLMALGEVLGEACMSWQADRRYAEDMREIERNKKGGLNEH